MTHSPKDVALFLLHSQLTTEITMTNATEKSHKEFVATTPRRRLNAV